MNLIVENQLMPQLQYHTDCKMIVQKRWQNCTFPRRGQCPLTSSDSWQTDRMSETHRIRDENTRPAGRTPSVFAMRPAFKFPKRVTKIQAIQRIIILFIFTQTYYS